MSKARVCEICKRVVLEYPTAEMLYEIYIAESDDYECDTAAERNLLLRLEDVCPDCTAKVKSAIQFIRTGRIPRKK
jgi:hypothetical protein